MWRLWPLTRWTRPWWLSCCPWTWLPRMVGVPAATVCACVPAVQKMLCVVCVRMGGWWWQLAPGTAIPSSLFSHSQQTLSWDSNPLHPYPPTPYSPPLLLAGLCLAQLGRVAEADVALSGLLAEGVG